MQAGENQPQPRRVRHYTGELSRVPGRLPEDTWRRRAALAGRRSRSLAPAPRGMGSSGAARPASLLLCSSSLPSAQDMRHARAMATRSENSAVAAESVLGVRGTHRNKQPEPSSTEDLVRTEIRGKRCLPCSVHTLTSPDSLCFHLYILSFCHFIPF